MTPFLLTVVFYGLVKSCAGADTLSADQTLSGNQTLISQNQDFELGFFSPASSHNSFLAIWYRSTPDVVVWVANQNDPIKDSQGVILQVARNGKLIITRNGSTIWSSNSSAVASNLVLQLLDTGNLVLADKTKEPQENYIWQSFDYPTDTRLPGMLMVYSPDEGGEKYLRSWKSSDDPSPGNFTYRIENKEELVQMVTMEGTKRIYRSGMWNGVQLNVPTFFNTVYKGRMVVEKSRTTYMDPYNRSILTRLVLDPSGMLHRYTMNEVEHKWNLLYTIPRDPCDDYGNCGPNGLCRTGAAPICECMDGFAPKVKANWDFQDWSDGCTRIHPLSCGNGDGFLELKEVKFPDIFHYTFNPNMSISECRDECLKNCSCTAYAQPYINGEGRGSGCLMWFGDLIDTRVLPGANKNYQNIYIRLPVSELDKMKTKRHTKLMAISVAMGILIFSLIGGATVLVRRRKRQERKNEDLELPLFSFATIAAATNNFSKENIIGEGGFGPVYKGKLSAEEEIAVKRLSETSTQGLEEFKNEVILFSKLQHTNLVRLFGCCIKGEERLLIYEYLQNRSLDYHIFDQDSKTQLTWPKRYDIILGIARGLLYLHHDSRLKIIHRDLKASNILLDENLNPKISDFGLARTFKGDQFITQTRRVVGTYGYMAPEYAIDGNFSVKSDVFSFGVVILEIVSGKKNRGSCYGDHHQSLLGHAWLLWKENKALELMDERVKDTFIECEAKRCIQVGLLCIQRLAEDRPIMPSVVSMLGCEGAVVPEPKEPGFFMERSSYNVEKYTSSTKASSIEAITITQLEAR